MPIFVICIIILIYRRAKTAERPVVGTGCRKEELQMMTVKNKHTRILIFLVCIILGYMITMQLKSHNQYQNLAIQRAEDLTVRLKEVQADRDKLAKELDGYRAGRISGAAQKEMDDLKARAGETEMEGKGIVFTLDDSKQAAKAGENKNLYIIHDEDLLRVVNELRAAGAEAISLNGQRLIGSSEIRCVGPTVLVNESRLAAPFVILAIGNPQTLESSLKLRGGVIENFKFWGIKADVVQSDKVRVPAFKGKRTFEFAKTVAEEEKKEAGQTATDTKGTAEDKAAADAGRSADRQQASQKNAGGAQ